MFEAVASGIKLPYYFMHAAIDGAALICSIADQAKVLLIAEYKSYVSGLFKFTLFELSSEHTVYKKQVNVISSKSKRDVVRGKVVSEKVGKMQTGEGRGSQKVGD